MEVLEAMRRQLDVCSQLNQSLIAQTRQAESAIGEMEQRLRPITTL